MLIFLAMPTKGAVLNNAIRPTVLAFVAQLHMMYPQHTFVVPMIQDYQLLPYMPKTEATWEAWWGQHCRALIEKCDALWVLQMDGWDTSTGVAGELKHADQHGIPTLILNC